MKITVTLSQADVLEMVYAGLRQRNLVPSDGDGDAEMHIDSPSTFRLELRNVDIVATPVSVPHYGKIPVKVATEVEGETPPIEKEAVALSTEPENEEVVGKELATILSQNAALLRPKVKDAYVPARDRFKTTQTADELEGLIPDPTDFRSEI